MERKARRRERASTVFAVTDACAGCGACLPTCPERAFLPGRTGGRVPLVILEDRCTGCAECAEVCPVAAIVEVEKTGEER
ncbi:4Fe-4S dicluster domain-containing protein [Rubrobacter radiotolerans DSM 5868]|nr:4Fe-4S dicluster domain-containing protein [Rubrobacter radiotolerans DSM 5868]